MHPPYVGVNIGNINGQIQRFILHHLIKTVLSLTPQPTSIPSTVIKPGSARRVDPGPGRPGGWTGPGLIKDRLWQQPDQTRATRRVDPELG
jgi:hypothetical protein